METVQYVIMYIENFKGVNIMKNPIVTIEMQSKNKIIVELYPTIAKNTVDNFISLVRKGFYNGTIFHRVIENFMIQGGDPQGTGMGGPGYSIIGEFDKNGIPNNLTHSRGVISMARSQHPDSAGSQFFIMHANVTRLDGSYAAFGKVVSGIEEVDRIATVKKNHLDRPLQDEMMVNITVELNGYQTQEPQKAN